MSLELEMKQLNKWNWNKINRELKLTVRDFVYYYGFRYHQVTDEFYPLKEVNWHYVGNLFKKHILDEFVVRGFGVQEMKEYIDWIFEKKKQKQWDLKFMKFHIGDWLKQRAVKSWQTKVMTEDQFRSRRLEEQQLARYFGEGYFDNQLMKEQFWIGLMWRKKNLSSEKMKELHVWQKKEFSPIELMKLKKWEKEFEDIDFNVRKAFYIELARSKNQTLLQILHEFHRDKYYGLFSKEELEMSWK